MKEFIAGVLKFALFVGLVVVAAYLTGNWDKLTYLVTLVCGNILKALAFAKEFIVTGKMPSTFQ